MDFAAPELVGVDFLERCRFGFGGAYVLACLVEVSLGCFGQVRVVLLYILGGEEWPADKVASLDSLEPSGFDWVATDRVHPLDGLFCGGQVIHTVCLAEDCARLFGGDP